MRSMLVPRKDDHLRRVARHTRQLDFTPPLPAEGRFPEERFLDFHRKNPQVFRNIVTLARARVRAQERLSMKGIFEDLRKEWAKVHKVTDYGLDNNWTPFYSRILTRDYPEFAGKIEQRKQRVAVSGFNFARQLRP